jgi:hypothetical protein
MGFPPATQVTVTKLGFVLVQQSSYAKKYFSGQNLDLTQMHGDVSIVRRLLLMRETD